MRRKRWRLDVFPVEVLIEFEGDVRGRIPDAAGAVGAPTAAVRLRDATGAVRDEVTVHMGAPPSAVSRTTSRTTSAWPERTSTA